MRGKLEHGWESYPEYIALQQYGRCLGGVLSSAPRHVRRRAGPPLIRAAVLISTSIALAHMEVGGDGAPDGEGREEFRRTALECVELSRHGLATIALRVSRPHLTAALELLERVEAGVRERPLPIA
jgi:hypothetical protein